jgi:hypothetical protein
MLLVYRHTLELGTGTLEAMFGVSALGLIPGLLLAGPLSDARGRRTVVIAAAGLSLLASAVLVAGADRVALLFVGRLMAGVSSGAVFAAGTAWLREISLAPAGTGYSERGGATGCDRNDRRFCPWSAGSRRAGAVGARLEDPALPPAHRLHGRGAARAAQRPRDRIGLTPPPDSAVGGGTEPALSWGRGADGAVGVRGPRAQLATPRRPIRTSDARSGDEERVCRSGVDPRPLRTRSTRRACCRRRSRNRAKQHSLVAQAGVPLGGGSSRSVTTGTHRVSRAKEETCRARADAARLVGRSLRLQRSRRLRCPMLAEKVAASNRQERSCPGI